MRCQRRWLSTYGGLKMNGIANWFQSSSVMVVGLLTPKHPLRRRTCVFRIGRLGADVVTGRSSDCLRAALIIVMNAPQDTSETSGACDT